MILFPISILLYSNIIVISCYKRNQTVANLMQIFPLATKRKRFQVPSLLDDQQPVQRGVLVFGHQSKSTASRISASASTVEQQQTSISEQHPICEFCFQSPCMVPLADESTLVHPACKTRHRG